MQTANGPTTLISATEATLTASFKMDQTKSYFKIIRPNFFPRALLTYESADLHFVICRHRPANVATHIQIRLKTRFHEMEPKFVCRNSNSGRVLHSNWKPNEQFQMKCDLKINLTDETKQKEQLSNREKGSSDFNHHANPVRIASLRANVHSFTCGKLMQIKNLN